MDTQIILFFAAALLASFLMFLALRWPNPDPEAEPVRGTILDQLESGVRLRDVFMLAATIEEQGIHLYRALANIATNAEVEKLCLKLSSEEAAHKALLHSKLLQWRPLPPHQLLAPKLIERAKLAGILTDPPAVNASERDMVLYAIEQERRSADFYQSMEKAFPDAWKRARIGDLVQEERKHERLLRTAYPDL